MRRMDCLVYRLPQGWKPRGDPPNRVNWTMADTGNTRLLFDEDKSRRETFLNFLREGSLGVFLYRHDTWIAYGWMSRPSMLGPQHLPRRIRSSSVYWIFYCRTRDGFGGLGFYKLVLRLLAQRAMQECENANVYVDTEINNMAARRAILSAGFEPEGAVTAYRLRVPKVNSWTWGRWKTDVAHPEPSGR
jgi:hypothetical protein